MKFADLYSEAIIWTCYLENFPCPERYLNIYGLSINERLMFDQLGGLSPFDEFYVRCPGREIARGISDLGLSKKSLILPWIYWPKGHLDTLQGKHVIAPSAEMFNRFDNKVETKKLFERLGIPTPMWSFSNNVTQMVEKPIQDSAGGLGISLTSLNPRDGYFLEEYASGYKSIGIQFFIYDEAEFICADEMLFNSDGTDAFTFHAQRNVEIDELPEKLIDNCLKLIEYISDKGYKGFIGIDVLVREENYYFLEINPRGIAFLPAYFAASARGWKRFKAYTEKKTPGDNALILLDFGKLKKVVERLS